MFGIGKSWALPTLDDLKDKLGSKDLKVYFPYIGLNWRENVGRAPVILRNFRRL